ncbi:hypothetical protein [Actinoplanes sp. NPDC089786]|uniref:hypothetical protein n=1 Tax=Actinoplanes sp. NPDC089786 TaxID=3155185 RepID=UPI00342E8F6B
MNSAVRHEALKNRVERQPWAQAELARILDNRALAGIPPGFGDVEDIPDAHRFGYPLYSRLALGNGSRR